MYHYPSIDGFVQSFLNDIAHSLGKETVAEYVENAEILQFLYESGVNYVQGHFLSPPMDVSTIDPRANRSSADGSQSSVSGEKINN
ncbi:MAG: EAL domain-containing protein [Candidatus Thiodiazotropha sp. (ex Gloverina cf. vestifex)]|nr:EAL domain-containing protein [Candidatus Thiodiazotropha sp. (ex Gloverina cf. vestifex)]